MPIRGRHPRHDNDPSVGVGDVVHHPEHGPITVGEVGGRGRPWFTGTMASGEPFGKTHVGLSRGENLYGDPVPWRVERRE